MPTQQGRDRLAYYTYHRRKELGLSQEALAVCGGPGSVTVRKIEHADDADWEPTTLRRLDAGLDWEPGSAAALLHERRKEPRLRGHEPSARVAEPVRTASGLWDESPYWWQDDQDDAVSELPARTRRAVENIVGSVSLPRGGELEHRRAAS